MKPIHRRIAVSSALLVSCLAGATAIGAVGVDAKTDAAKQDIPVAAVSTPPVHLPGFLDAALRNTPTVETPVLSQLSNELEALSAHGLRSVVSIRTVATPTARTPSRGLFPGFPFDANPGPRRGAGSGVLVSDDGLIVTNHHVIDGAEEVTVVLTDGRTFDGEVVGSDPATDVAMIRLPDTADNLTPARFADSDDVAVGELVVAIGNPFGLDGSVTMGIVSATGRSRVGITEYEDFIQTDSAINPGNSGGALMNTRGELIGINTAIASRSGGSQGVGFAVPSNMVRLIIEDLADDGVVRRGWLGVSIGDVTAKLTEAIGQAAGAHVVSVMPDGPAAAAGLSNGDVIIRVDDTPVSDADGLRYAIAAAAPGSNVRLTVVRTDGEQHIDVELGERPALN